MTGCGTASSVISSARVLALALIACEGGRVFEYGARLIEPPEFLGEVWRPNYHHEMAQAVPLRGTPSSRRS